MEVLLVIEQCQKRLDRVFSPEEIEAGVLKDLLIESDYDVITAVSTYPVYFSRILSVSNERHRKTRKTRPTSTNN